MLTRSRRYEFIVKLVNLVWFCYQVVGNNVQDSKHSQRHICVVFEVNLARMHGVVSDDAQQIQGLLDFWAQSVRYQFFDIGVYIFPILPELHHELLER